MKLTEMKIKKVIKDYNLIHREDVIDFIELNPENLPISYLARISELVNNSRVDTAAYYTDPETLNIIEASLPIINKKTIRVLEPSVGVGNFLDIIINKYKNADKLIIDVNDLDIKSLKITKLLNEKRILPDNIEINYYNCDFLTDNFENLYDLVIGNPPFLKITNSHPKNYSKLFSDEVTKNLSGFFIQKATSISKYVVLILPKYFLSNPDFSITRDRVEKFSVEKIIDFGEKGFKGVLIETIAIYIDTQIKITNTVSYSVTLDLENIQTQNRLVDKKYPYWLLYRNDFFDIISQNMTLNVFKVFRDRQLTNKFIVSAGDIRVLKSRNIRRNGSGIDNIDNYDGFINTKNLKNMAVRKYLNRTDVFLSPNMTYYPRVIRKPENTVVNGSVAILENISNIDVTDQHLSFLSSEVFERYYRIALNYSTRSLNIDKNSVVFFGLYNENKEKVYL